MPKLRANKISNMDLEKESRQIDRQEDRQAGR